MPAIIIQNFKTRYATNKINNLFKLFILINYFI